MFAQFEFVEYEKVFQNILYFAHVEPKEINEPETNKLCWKLARKHWVPIFEIFKEIRFNKNAFRTNERIKR